MNAQQLQAEFARRREQEHARIESTAAVNRYYDHWNKVTSRFETWTTPEYYKHADEKLQKTKEQKDKEKKLLARQELLRNLLSKEKEMWDRECAIKNSKPKSALISTETLEKVKHTVEERENLRRKLALEAKLYSKWRHGADDPNIIFESKSDHEVLAKLNWLDKQVEFQMHKEEEEKRAKEQQLRLQEEIRKTEQTQKERQKIREQEIKEIRALQENHLQQLKQRQLETENYKQQEKLYKSYLDDLTKEIELLQESSDLTHEPKELSQAFNLKKIKVYIRKRSDIYRNQINVCLSILKRVASFASDQQQLDCLIKKYTEQLDIEHNTLSQIDAMYESEAKYNLKRCEDAWQMQHIERVNEMTKFLHSEKNSVSILLQNNQEEQEELLEIRETHLKVIENSNEKLKCLIKEQDSKELNCNVPSNIESDAGANISLSKPDISMQPNVSRVTSTFDNLNISSEGMNNYETSSQSSLNVVSSENVERPKFGRKRVAWN